MDKRVLLTTQNCILRHFILADTEEVYRFSQEKTLKKWIPNQVYADLSEAEKTLEHLISMYDTNKLPYVLAITTAAGVIIGHVGLSEIKQGVEIGYAVGEAFQGRGYGTEAVKAYTAWGKQHFGLNRVYGAVKAGNAASCRVLEKSGYTYLKDDIEGDFDQDTLRVIYVHAHQAK